MDRDRRLGIYFDFGARQHGQAIPLVQPQTTVPFESEPSEDVPPAPSEPPVPTAAEVAQMPIVELRGFLLFAVDRLEAELAELSTGADWMTHLQTADLKRLVPQPQQAPPPPSAVAAPKTAPSPPLVSPETRTQLGNILKKFDTIVRNPEYEMISSLWGFRAVHVALAEFLVPQVQRNRNQLVLAVDVLNRELDQFSVGSGWKEHLSLDQLRAIADTKATELKSSDIQDLKSILKTFDDVRAYPDYRTISELPGFKQTQYSLRVYMADANEAVRARPRT